MTQLVSTCTQFMTSCMGPVDPLMRPSVRTKLIFLLLHLEWHQILYLLETWVRLSSFLRHHEWDQVHYLKHHERNQMFYSLTPCVRPIDQAMAGDMKDIKCSLCWNHEWTSQQTGCDLRCSRRVKCSRKYTCSLMQKCMYHFKAFSQISNAWSPSRLTFALIVKQNMINQADNDCCKNNSCINI